MSRSQTLVENFFGESIMLHQQNLLGDVLRNRPVIDNLSIILDGCSQITGLVMQ